MPQLFTCGVCDKRLEYPVHNTPNPPTGFAQHGNVKVCYNCDATVLIQNMAAQGRINLHLNLDLEFGWVLKNWPGTLQFQTIGINPELQMSERQISPRPGAVPVDMSVVYFEGPDKLIWIGTARDLDLNQSNMMFCQRLNPQPEKRQPNPHPKAKEFEMFVPNLEYAKC